MTKRVKMLLLSRLLPMVESNFNFIELGPRSTGKSFVFKRMEFWDTNFSYIDKDTQEEFFVGLPEEKGSNLIENTPLSPGVCYTATSDGDSLAIVRIEVVTTSGNGKLISLVLVITLSKKI